MAKESGGINSSPEAPFDRATVRLHRLRAAAGFETHDFLFREIADRMDERLGEIQRDFARILVVGNHGGIAARIVSRRYPGAQIVVMDLDRTLLHGARQAVAADEEALPFAPDSFDLVISLLDLHWVNDLPGALVQLRMALRPDGLLLATMIGGESLLELRHALLEGEAAIEGGASPRVSPFLDARTAGGLLQRAGLALPMVDVDRVSVTYMDAFAAMVELRGMGEANAVATRRKGFTRRATLMAAAEAYQKHYARADGRLPLTFDILYLTGWAPDESQPKPLKPGSASASLADALSRKKE